MATKVQLSRKVNGSFIDVDSKLYALTHISTVDGLLDSNSKLNISLFNDALLNTKRMAGTITSNTNFVNLLAAVATYNDEITSLYGGTYFISNGSFTVGASVDHKIMYGDDGSGIQADAVLEQGDHIFYIKSGTGYYWNSVVGPHIAHSDNNYYGSKDEMNADVQTVAAKKAIIAGFDLEPTVDTNFQVTVNTTGGVTKDAIFYQLHIVSGGAFWADPQENAIVKVIDTIGGTVYWKVLYSPDARAYYESAAFANTHLWGIINNSYPLATTQKAGLMNYSDKSKLDSLFNYSHPTQAAISVDTANVDVLDELTVNTLGHITAATKRTLPTTAEANLGVVQLATKAEAQAVSAQSTTKALSVMRGQDLVEFFGNKVPLYATEAAAQLDVAKYVEGSIVFINLGTV